MSSPIRVHLLPSLMQPAALRGGVAIILDILRASTTIVHALANGARAVIPVGEVDDALSVRDRFPAGEVLLGGEREGLQIDGFDLDNNPFAYTRAAVAGKTIAFTTTNGTRALLRSREAESILIGAFVNLRALLKGLQDDPREIHLVCAGTRGEISTEDVLAAGAIAEKLAESRSLSVNEIPDDQTQLAIAAWRQASWSQTALLHAMRASFGGRNCVRLGFDEQIERAATRDVFDIVPSYDSNTGEIQ